ncbi:MAG: hypothetical protein ACI9U2_003187 [Bradymonadia bacterium]|jgi:hypothetical protein
MDDVQPTKIQDAVLAFLDNSEWPYAPLPNNPDWLRMVHNGGSGQWQCYLQTREKQEQLFFFSMGAMYVPESKRPAVAEFLNRANYGLVIGNFEMDYNDGEVRFKTYFDAQGFAITRKAVEVHVFANLATFDRYNAGLMSVMFGDVAPADAIALIED